MPTATVSLNGKPQRKQLSDQIDRLDGIIDCLAEALPEAVGDATREGTRQAVREAITDVLTDPEVLSLLKAALTPSAAQSVSIPVAAVIEKPSLLGRAKSAIGRVLSGTAKRAKSIGAAIVRPLRNTAVAIKSRFDAARRKVREIACAFDVGMKLRKTLLIGASIGLVAMVASQMNHSVASILAGIGAATTAIAVQVGLQVRSFFRSFHRV